MEETRVINGEILFVVDLTIVRVTVREKELRYCLYYCARKGGSRE